MAKFINRQEEVIQLELTPWGKRMFSEGRLKPRYYAFYDDDVLYDQDYQPSGSIQKANPKVGQEKQNDIVSRIQEIPRLEIYSDLGWMKDYRSFEGSGDDDNAQFINITNPTPRQTSPATSKFLRPLGKNNPLEEYAPAWQIKTMGDGQAISMSGTEEFAYQGGASGSELIIPFISSSLPLDYEISTITVNLDADSRVVQEGGEETEKQLWELTNDGRLLLDVKEVNTMFKGGGNFDIEVFRAQPREGQGARTFESLKFINDKFENSLEMNLQQDPDEYARVLSGDDGIINEKIPKLNNTYVEYFLSIRVDDEIEDLGAQPEAGETLYKTAVSSDPVDPCEEP